MMGFDPGKLRNVGIAAHIDAGKTTTTERILFYSGQTHRMGDVDEGTTTTDFDEQEQKRGITIFSAAVSCPWRGYTINLIDTPGHVDFTAEVERSLRVLDGVVAVFDGKEGVEAQSETVWRQADRYEIPRICFINKMDRVGADFEHAVDSIRDRLDAHPLALQIPIGDGSTFMGLIDLIEMQAVYYRTQDQGASFEIRDIPEALIDQAQAARRCLEEFAAESSDAMMEKYISEAPMTVDELHLAIRKATIKREICPVLCGSSLKYVGVQRLMDAICHYLPNPLDVPAFSAPNALQEGVEHEIKCDNKAPLSALVFKIVTEKPVDLHYARIYSGTMKSSSRLLNSSTGKKENITRIFRMFAKRRDQLDEAFAGDIVALVGPKHSLTGHSLCDQKRPVMLEPIAFPETVISVSIEPKSSKDRDKLLEALKALVKQDPTLAFSLNEETGQTLLSGMGELHLEVMVQRLRSDMNVPVSVGNPRVAYRETVQRAGVGLGQFIRQVGGRDHFAKVKLRLEPRERVTTGPCFEISHELATQQMPGEWIAALETGITDAAQSGVLGGYPVIDWKGFVENVELDQQTSSELAFENAGRNAFYEAMSASNPVLLEPVMNIEIVTPDDYFGLIMSDLTARSGVVHDTATRGANRVVTADIPLAQTFGYITRLRSLSQGRATSSLTPSHYAPVSAAQMKTLVG